MTSLAVNEELDDPGDRPSASVVPDLAELARRAEVERASGELERLLFEEVVPALQGRVVEPEAFARQTLERFRNPFLEHKLSDILKHHDEKVQIRLVPTRREYQEKFRRKPPLYSYDVVTTRSASRVARSESPSGTASASGLASSASMPAIPSALNAIASVRFAHARQTAPPARGE